MCTGRTGLRKCTDVEWLCTTCGVMESLWRTGKPARDQRAFLGRMTGELFFTFGRRPLFHEIAHHLQERLSLGAQRAVTGMNEVEASVQRLGVDQLDGAQVTAADFGRDGHE